MYMHVRVTTRTCGWIATDMGTGHGNTWNLSVILTSYSWLFHHWVGKEKKNEDIRYSGSL